MTEEEAIKILQDVRDRTRNSRIIEAICTLHPELAESEDERIRKFLIKLVNDGLTSFPDSLMRSDVLAYLEKQKEQKPKYCHHDVDETGWTEEYRKAYYDGWSNCNMQHEQLKKEQKPAEWSDTNELVFQDICKHLKEEGYSGWVVLLNALRNGEFNPPTKQEWSEEDEEALDMCLDAIPKRWKTKSGILLTKWLKDNIHLQSKQEWSEEDEKMLTDISWAIRYCAYDDKKKERVMKWFNDDYRKFLRPQPQGVYKTAIESILKTCESYKKKGFFIDERAIDFLGIVRAKCKNVIERAPMLDEPSWKPSEEQMKALEKAIIRVHSDDEIPILTELRQQLKKLM